MTLQRPMLKWGIIILHKKCGFFKSVQIAVSLFITGHNVDVEFCKVKIGNFIASLSKNILAYQSKLM